MKLSEKLKVGSSEETKMARATVRFIPSWWIFETFVPEFQNAEFISAVKIEREEQLSLKKCPLMEGD
jgi:hypothetical protein